MEKINARSLLSMDKEVLWSRSDDGRVVLIFDDGELETTWRRTIYCAYLWNIHRRYTETPLLKKHHMGMERVSGNTHLKILSVAYKDCVMTYEQKNIPLNAEELWKLMYDTVNEIYNDFIQRLDAYVDTLSALDIIDVLDHSTIKKANHEVQPIQTSIDATYDIIDKTLMKDPTLNGNAVAEAVRSNLVSMSQVKQCVGPRGFVTEIDSTIFKVPITVGYGHGFRSLYDSMIESRSAAKALMFAKDPLAECEYFNRRLQLLAQVIDRLEMGDCGSQHYMSWEVSASDLKDKSIIGMHYVENGELKTINASDRHLIGQIVNLRTPFGCKHHDRQTVCSTCFGEIAYSIPKDTVLGHVSAISIGEKVTSVVLSTKHLDTSSVIDDVDLGEFYAAYLIPGSEEHTLRLSPGLKDIPTKVVISSETAKSLPDINRIKNFEEINVSRITEMSDVTFIVGDENTEGGVHEMVVPVSMGSRLGSLSGEALAYIKEHGTELDQKGDYVIDLSKWDNTKALFILPLKHISMFDYMITIQKIIFSSEPKQGLINYDNAYEAVQMLSRLINTRVSVNLAHVMIVSLAAAALDPKENDYRIPRGGEQFSFATYNDIMFYRSLGAKMAHEEQAKVFTNAGTFTVRNRPRHPMDELALG